MHVKQQQKPRGGHLGDVKQRRRLGRETIICQILLGVSCVRGNEDALIERNWREHAGAEGNSCEGNVLLWRGCTWEWRKRWLPFESVTRRVDDRWTLVCKDDTAGGLLLSNNNGVTSALALALAPEVRMIIIRKSTENHSISPKKVNIFFFEKICQLFASLGKLYSSPGGFGRVSQSHVSAIASIWTLWKKWLDQ